MQIVSTSNGPAPIGHYSQAIEHGGVVLCRGGSIEAASEPGQGTTFTILLPLVSETPTADGSEEATCRS